MRFASILFIMIIFNFSCVFGSELVPIDYQVICNEEIISKLVEIDVENILKTYEGFTIDKDYSNYKIILYIQKDINDRINPNGYSIAILHTSKLPLLWLARNLIENKNIDDKTKSFIANLAVREEGIVKHFNVAHVDNPTKTLFQILLKRVIDDFMTRYVQNSKSE